MKLPLVLLSMLYAPALLACLWDSDTLRDEKKKSPQLAAVVLGNAENKVDQKALRERIQQLESHPRHGDPAWWNDIAGAHIRLGDSKKAVELLQPLLSRFPDDYGIHANLGTAYHLLGNYIEAEKHIARDLELNPDAHFGLEKYHLALLQYLIRDREYQKHYVYVYEWTAGFRRDSSIHIQYYPVADLDPEFAGLKAEPPAYTKEFNLAEDPKFEEGVLYMASLNPKEPACFVMLGIACLKKRDLNLARIAFEKAITLGSPQTELLSRRIAGIEKHIREAREHNPSPVRIFAFAVGGGIAGLVIIRLCRRAFRKTV